MKSDKRLYLIVSLLVIAGYSWIAINLFYNHSAHQYMSLCLFKNITGIACPACGSTRAIVDLIHFNLSASIHNNPLGIPLFMGLLLLPFWLLYDFIFAERSLFNAFNRIETFIKANRSIQATLIVFILLNWGWGIYKGL